MLKYRIRARIVAMHLLNSAPNVMRKTPITICMSSPFLPMCFPDSCLCTRRHGRYFDGSRLSIQVCSFLLLRKRPRTYRAFSGPRILRLQFGVTTDAPPLTALPANVTGLAALVVVPRGTQGMTETGTGTGTLTGGTIETGGDAAAEALIGDAAPVRRGGGRTVTAAVLLPWKTSRRMTTAREPAVKLLPLTTKAK